MLNSFPVKIGTAITHASKKAPQSALKFGKHFRFYLGERGSHQQKMCYMVKHLDLSTHVQNLSNTLIGHGPQESYVLGKRRSTTISKLCFNRWGKIRKTHSSNHFLIVFSTKIHGLWSFWEVTITPLLPLYAVCEFHTPHTFLQEIVCPNLCW